MKRDFLISYDIRDPGRLRRVHRTLRRRALPVQYSVFLGSFDRRGLECVIAEVRAQIDKDEDDVRFYPLPDTREVVLLGWQMLPEPEWLLGKSRHLTSALSGHTVDPEGTPFVLFV